MKTNCFERWCSSNGRWNLHCQWINCSTLPFVQWVAVYGAAGLRESRLGLDCKNKRSAQHALRDHSEVVAKWEINLEQFSSEEKNANEQRGRKASVQLQGEDVKCTLLMSIFGIFDMMSCAHTVHCIWTRVERAESRWSSSVGKEKSCTALLRSSSNAQFFRSSSKVEFKGQEGECSCIGEGLMWNATNCCEVCARPHFEGADHWRVFGEQRMQDVWCICLMWDGLLSLDCCFEPDHRAPVWTFPFVSGVLVREHPTWSYQCTWCWWWSAG